MTRPTLDDPAIRTWRDQTLYRLLLRASRAETTATLEHVHALGYDDVSLADTNMLANLDMNGTIISALARRAGVTRQAAGQQVVALEQAGYVKRLASETDARAVVVHRSERGRALLSDALDFVEELEAGYCEVLGRSRFDTLKKLLTELLQEVDPVGVLGRE